jgi:transcriptional regulator of NAD metabolism
MEKSLIDSNCKNERDLSYLFDSLLAILKINEETAINALVFANKTDIERALDMLDNEEIETIVKLGSIIVENWILEKKKHLITGKIKKKLKIKY